MLYVILVEVGFFGNFSLLPPLVLQSSGYPVPPPTTLVGALAYPYFRRYGVENEGNYSIAKKLIEEKKVLYASFWTPLYISQNDLERVFSIAVQKSSRLGYLRKIPEIVECLKKLSSDPQYFANYSLCNSKDKSKDKRKRISNEEKKKACDKVKDCVKYINDGLKNAYGVGVRSSVYFADSAYLAYIVTDKDLVKFAYGISRIGRKESIVYIKDVNIYKFDEILVNKDDIETRFYFPKSLSRNYNNCELYHFPILDVINFGSNYVPKTDEFCIPQQYSLNPILATIDLDKSYVLDLKIGHGYLPVPKEVVENS